MDASYLASMPGSARRAARWVSRLTFVSISAFVRRDRWLLQAQLRRAQALAHGEALLVVESAEQRCAVTAPGAASSPGTDARAGAVTRRTSHSLQDLQNHLSTQSNGVGAAVQQPDGFRAQSSRR